MMTFTTVKSLEELKNQDLDLIISTRFDINFKQNPFEVYDYDFTKCSFLWREPEFMDLPIVNDTFIVFPYHMLENMIESFIEQETNPPGGVQPGNHNIYVPMVKRVGEDNVVWVQEEFGIKGPKGVDNDLYRLERTEFMPFAPVTPEKFASEAYEDWKPEHVASHFMTRTYNCKTDFILKHPAVVHIDKTARPQIIKAEHNQRYYDVIKTCLLYTSPSPRDS